MSRRGCECPSVGGGPYETIHHSTCTDKVPYQNPYKETWRERVRLEADRLIASEWMFRILQAHDDQEKQAFVVMQIEDAIKAATERERDRCARWACNWCRSDIPRHSNNTRHVPIQKGRVGAWCRSFAIHTNAEPPPNEARSLLRPAQEEKEKTKGEGK